MRLQPEDDGLAPIGCWLRGLTVDMQGRVRHRQRVKLLVYTRSQLLSEASARLRHQAPALEHAVLCSSKFTFDGCWIRAGRRQLVNASARFLKPHKQPVDIRSPAAQCILNGCASRVNLGEPLRVRVKTRHVRRNIIGECFQFEHLVACPSDELSHGLVETCCIVELRVRVTGCLNSPRIIAPIIALQIAKCHTDEGSKILHVREACCLTNEIFFLTAHGVQFLDLLNCRSKILKFLGSFARVATQRIETMFHLNRTTES